MAEIHRFSSRRQRLDQAFLANRLKGARSYKRIAGYFRSSIFELVGEEIADIPRVQIVCNSALDAADIVVSQHARETALKERWNEVPAEVEALLHQDRYRRLHALLSSGRVEIRVVPRDRVFVHGKAGVIEAADGSKTCFLGSINETRRAFAHNYEILWEDTSPEGVQWVEEEFEALWQEAFPLPDAIVEEIQRIANRVEVRFADVSPNTLPAAALVESPIYRGGEQLQPWQRAFVTMFLKHRDTYGKARLLLADEVGLGKTLSLATSAMVAALLDDGPVLILCPSTLTLQWQVELKDKLGIPSAMWLSTKKVWMDDQGHTIKTRGPEDITRCPCRIAIVSTGLIVHNSDERRALLGRKFGTVILDEAHKARRRGALGETRREPNNLLAFMLRIGPRTKHLLLDRGFGSLGFFEQQTVLHTLAPGYYRTYNPIVRHTVLRRRQTLEEAGLLDKIAVTIHPDPHQPSYAYPGIGFMGLGLLTNHPFDLAYQAAEDFTAALHQRTRAAGCMKTLLLQRLCSSFASGQATAATLLRGDAMEEEDELSWLAEPLSDLTPTEAGYLRLIIEELGRPEARDPKLAAVMAFLTEHRIEGKTWLEHGCIIFSQYYDTAQWVAAALAQHLSSEPVAVYAGTGKSRLFRGDASTAVQREDIKKAVKQRDIRLVVATDAACEGLNLQTLGTLINVDLSWNPSRLEQRLGRIKRFGQVRRTVDMLNLVYHETQDERVYQVLSRRLKDKFDLFGGLPDTIEDDWIESVEKLEAMMDTYIHLRQQDRDVFELRYKDTIDPDQHRCELCSRVLARKDVVEKLSEAW